MNPDLGGKQGMVKATVFCRIRPNADAVGGAGVGPRRGAACLSRAVQCAAALPL